MNNNLEQFFINKKVNIDHFPTKEELHTDVLERKYGPIHAVVLRHDNVQEMKAGADRVREARLVDEQDILRTYALTFLTYDKRDDEIANIDNEIREGGLIGKTFKNHGYEVKKNVIDVFLMETPEWMKNDFKDDSEKAKARLTEFYARKEENNPIIYGVVLEVYSPDFKNPEDGINETDLAQVNPLTGTLQSVGVPVDEIWGRLDRASEANEWDDLKDKYEQAEELSKPAVQLLHEKISKYVSSK